MRAHSNADGIADRRDMDDFHKRRQLKDALARWLIAVGGVAVIGAVVLILFYLLWVVFPLFLPSSSESETLGQRSAWTDEPPLYLSVEEQLEVGTRVTADGTIEFFQTEDLAPLAQERFAPLAETRLSAAAESDTQPAQLALLAESGEIFLLERRFSTNYDDGIENRRIEPGLDFPYGTQWRPLTDGSPVVDFTFSSGDNSLVVAAVSRNQLFVSYGSMEQNFLTGERTLDSRNLTAELGFTATSIAISGNHRWAYLGDDQGQIHRYDLPSMNPSQTLKVSDAAITELHMLLGSISVLAGDADGGINQLFPVRDDDNAYQLTPIRSFPAQKGAIERIQTEYRRKGFIAIDSTGMLGVYHSTAGQRVMLEPVDAISPEAFALSPRANGLLTIGANGAAELLRLDNKHPEISFSSLWGKVWYENYAEPAHIWQSSSASNDFEPKFSLTPLAFGTLKAALYAMLFAVPFALAGAAFTAYFMAPGLRQVVKPTIEIMAALPTVILGFLAGLWFAPFLEENLAGVFAIFLVVPVGLLIFSWFGSQNPFLRRLAPEGWEPALLIPVMIVLVWAALALAGPIQDLFFAGNMRLWFSQELGISYDQRNALVVGVAMGFAVIPTIFSIAEDAVFGVPKSLSDGSLALGATRWQTMIRVILPTASPGIFSGLMIGLGRAVGETMIVLMATGNTPIMDWNLFEGMRTLAANIAVEMPESEVNSSHYRILFLAALTLFVFTFVVNTGAEVIRQRLREKYSSL